jgi:hypothetical protein
MRRNPGNDHLADTMAVDGQDPPRSLGFLPRVEPVDQIKPRPRHLDTQVGSALAERGLHHPQTLIEREPGRPGMPRHHLALLDGGVQAEPKRGMPTHLTDEHPSTHRQHPDVR